MFAGQANFFAVNLDPETKFGNHKYVVSPEVTARKMYRRD